MSTISPVRAMSWLNLIQEFAQTVLMSTGHIFRESSIKILEQFVVYLSKRQVNAKTIGGYGAWLKEGGICDATVQKKIIIIRRFLTWCFRMNYCTERWYEYLPVIRLSARGDPTIIGHDEYLRIRSCCKNKNKEFIVVLAYSTGFRMGDCCCLRWSNVDQERQIISMTPRKTSRRTGVTATIPYSTGSDLHMILIEMWANRHEQPNPEGEDYICPLFAYSYVAGHDSIKIQMSRVFKLAGLPHKTFRNFRSTFESRIANSGMNIGLAAKLTGRSDTKTLLRYIKPDMDVAREGIAKALELHNTYPAFK